MADEVKKEEVKEVVKKEVKKEKPLKRGFDEKGFKKQKDNYLLMRKDADASLRKLKKSGGANENNYLEVINLMLDRMGIMIDE